MKQKNLIIIGVVLLLLVIGTVFVIVRGNKPQTNPSTNTDEEAIPTVDASVKVSLDKVSNPATPQDIHSVVLHIDGVPKRSKSIEYELTYATPENPSEGVLSSPAQLKDNQDTYEKEILLGTCSAGGACSYHQVTGKIKVHLLFNGSYGQRLFEKEFDYKAS